MVSTYPCTNFDVQLAKQQFHHFTYSSELGHDYNSYLPAATLCQLSNISQYQETCQFMERFHTCMVLACMFQIAFPLLMTKLWNILMSHLRVLDWPWCIPRVYIFPSLFVIFTILFTGGHCVQ